MNKDEIDAVAKAATEVLKAVPVYQDAVQPVAQEVGQALKTVGGVINVALAPLAAMVYGYDVIKTQLRTRLEKRLENTPPENIVTPQLQVVGPLLDKYKYVHDNEDLSEMFVNLLANAMDKDAVKKAHPSFVNVIAELSPDEARLLKKIAREATLPKIDIQIKHPAVGEKKEGYTEACVNFTNLSDDAGLQYPDLTPSYISNLERLNIISCPVGSLTDEYTNEKLYEPLENSVFVGALRDAVKLNGKDILISRGIIRITDFGKMFLDAVILKK